MEKVADGAALAICGNQIKRKMQMKTHGHYKTIAAIKQTTEIIEILIGKKVKSSKVRQWNIRDMKREYRSLRPRKARCNYEN